MTTPYPLKPLPLREQMRLWDEILTERFESVLPAAMARAELDMWLTVTSENNEDPVTRSLLPAALMEPRGKMLLLFVRDGDAVRRLSISRPASIEHLYENPWYGIGPGTDWKGHHIPSPAGTQWECLREIVERYAPRRIGVNRDEAGGAADGLRASDDQLLRAALGDKWASRLVSAREAVTCWLETRTDREISLYASGTRIAHQIIDEAFSPAHIVPYVTTNDDVRFYMMQRAQEMGLPPTFECTVAVFRHGLPGMHNEPILIQPGDVVHCDFGLKYMNLCTDAQELGYVLKPGETQPPEGLQNALRITNRLQDIVRAAMKPGVSGNDALRSAREAALAEGISPTVYCHPIGYHPHAAGPAVGRFGNQGPSSAGAPLFYDHTAHALELNALVPIPEWDGQELMCCLESEIWLCGEEALFLYEQPRRYHLIG
jgi:Xaa-Pro aminopeptidase